jgi:hypothetical protein
MRNLLISAGVCALVSSALPVVAAAQSVPPTDALAALIAKLDAVLAAGVTPEAAAAILGSSLAPPGPDLSVTLLADADQSGYRLSGIAIAGGASGTPRIGFDLTGRCIASEDAAPLFPAAQWAPYPDRDPRRFSQLVETRVGSTIKLTFRLGDGCLAAISMEKAPSL